MFKTFLRTKQADVIGRVGGAAGGGEEEAISQYVLWHALYLCPAKVYGFVYPLVSCVY